jgi:hypothetical protein
MRTHVSALVLFGALTFVVRVQAQPAGVQGPAEASDAGGAPSGAAPEGVTPAESSGARRAPAQVPVLTPEARAELGSAPGEAALASDDVQRLLVPPLFLMERGRDRATTAVFPLFFRDRRGASEGIFVPPYYRYRSPTLQADAFFPFFFHWRGAREAGGDWSTLVVPPVYVHRWQGRGELQGRAFGVAPLFFYGESFDEDGALRREHLIIPPLLTVHTWRPEHAFTLIGPFFYDRLRADTDWGLAPLVFGGSNLHGSYLYLPPLLTFHRENRDENRSLTVVGPFWYTRSPEAISFNLAPLFFHHHDRTSSRTTFAPLFHIDASPERRTVVTPFFYWGRRGDERTFVSWLYQYHRGTTDWDAVAPFFFSSRERVTGHHTEALLPFFYHRSTSNSRTLFVLPPLFHYEREGRDWFFNAYPLLTFLGGNEERSYTVLGPLFARFQNHRERTDFMMVTPLFWRYSTPESNTLVIPPVLWMESQRQGVRSYEWHLLPLFSYARPRPEDVSWNILFGLIGYRRSGSHRQLRLFYAPIDLD